MKEKELKMERVIEKKIECSVCNSKKLKVTSGVKSFAYMGGVCLLATSCFLWIPFIGWVAVPLTLMLSVVCFALSLLCLLVEKEYDVSCEDCGAKFKVNKKEYKKYLKN